MSKYAELSVAELQSKLKSIRAVQITTASIFAVIVLAWILLGYWRTNLPVFISTLAMGVVAVAAARASEIGLKAALAKRQNNEDG